MFWVDEITEEILKTYPDKDEFILRDEKTPSGRVHIGSMRGVVIHAVIAQALREKGKKARFIYEFNDADPMDGLPVYLDEEKYKPFMGKPLRDVPSPHEELGGEPAKNYAEYFAREFLDIIRLLGFEPEIVYSSDLYAQGHYDEWMKKILDNEDKIRQIYKEVSGSEKPEDWHPLNVVCEKCGRVGTTKVTGWDGEKVTYECMKDMVNWAEGCGHKAAVSPFAGVGKLPWKVEWPVKWASMKVDVEGAGKDHCAAGGSHEVAERICREILKADVPFNIPYEFFLYGGAKMSSSKGEGASVREVAETVPPELLRFLMVRKKPNQPIDFDPNGPTIPNLFDNHDQTAMYYFDKTDEFPDMARVFHFSQLDPSDVAQRYFPRFSKIAFLEQIPHVDIFKEVEAMKESKLTKEDEEEVRLRKHFAGIWLEKFAPDSHKFIVAEELPEEACGLAEEQKKFLGSLGEALEEKDWNAEELHAKVHELKEATGLPPKEVFGALYVSLLGKDSGPKAGWFLEALDQDFLIKRFKEASK